MLSSYYISAFSCLSSCFFGLKVKKKTYEDIKKKKTKGNADEGEGATEEHMEPGHLASCSRGRLGIGWA